MLITEDGFTYETSKSNALETYEWDNIWWEQAPDREKPRVLIVGDSISCGYRRMVTEELEGAVLADGLGTSKAVDNPCFFSLISLVMQQAENYRIVFFNNGLHGYHLNQEEYERYYDRLVQQFMAVFPHKLVLINSTPVADSRKPTEDIGDENIFIRRRNEAVEAIAEKYGLNCIDFHSIVANRKDLHSTDDIHLTECGYRLLAQKLAEYIKSDLL